MNKTVMALLVMILSTAAASSKPVSPSYVQYTTTNGQHRMASYFRMLSVKMPRLSGVDVREVQRRLLQVLPAAQGLKIDGYYGPATAAAVKHYQIGNDLTPSGVLNYETWEVLFNIGE